LEHAELANRAPKFALSDMHVNTLLFTITTDYISSEDESAHHFVLALKIPDSLSWQSNNKFYQENVFIIIF